MQEQRGNFLLQVLLALTLVFAFMPFIANRLASRDMSAKMYAAKTSVESLHNAARFYARENKDTFVCASENNPTTYSNTDLRDLLIPYGLPVGFVPITALNQNMSLQIVKKRRSCGDDVDKTTVDVIVSRGDLSQYQLAELARMIGFFARAEGDIIRVNVPVDVIYSDIVRRRETNEQIGFLTDLEMGGCECVNADDVFPDCTQTCAYHSVNDVNVLHAERGDLKRAQITMLTLLGDGLGANQNEIKEIDAGTFIFRSAGNTAALNVKGNVTVDTANLQGIGTYLKTDELLEGEESQYEDAYVENHNLDVYGKIDLNKGLGFYIKYARQDPNFPERLNYGMVDMVASSVDGETPRTTLTVENDFRFLGGGITNFETVSAKNIFVYPTTPDGGVTMSEANKNWGLSATKFLIPGVIIVDQNLNGNAVDYDRRVAQIAPGGKSVFEDVSFVLPVESEQGTYSSDNRIGNNFLMDGLRIPKNPAIKYSGTNIAKCPDVFGELFAGGWTTTGNDTQYDNYSLMQNMLCQYVYLARLERFVNCVLCCRDNSCGNSGNRCNGDICTALEELGNENPW